MNFTKILSIAALVLFFSNANAMSETKLRARVDKCLEADNFKRKVAEGKKGKNYAIVKILGDFSFLEKELKENSANRDICLSLFNKIIDWANKHKDKNDKGPFLEQVQSFIEFFNVIVTKPQAA